MGEGQEYYDAAVEAGDANIYLDKMTDKENREALEFAKETAFDRRNISVEDIEKAKDKLRSRAQWQAGKDNEHYDKVKTDLARPFDEVYAEAKAVQEMADYPADREQRKTTSSDYRDATETVERQVGRDSTFLGDFVENASEARMQRDLISPELKNVILTAAEERFEKYVDRLRVAQAAIEKAKRGTFEADRANDTKRQILNEFEEEVLADENISTFIKGNPELEEAVNKWARRLYQVDLEKYVDNTIETDGYSI